jgi:hypothetical protein
MKKVKLFLYFIKNQGMNTYGVVEVRIYVFLTLALGGGKWTVKSSGRFIQGERSPGALWEGG